MTNTKDKANAAEDMAFEETPEAEGSVGREPVDITVTVGQKVKIAGTVVGVDDDAVTIEIDDGIEGNIHRVTLNSNQAAAALK
jgi:HSP20 family molecular chaperone IbpA